LRREPDRFRRFDKHVILTLPDEGTVFEMGRFALWMVAGMFVAVTIPCLAQELKPYPGAKLDDKASREASAAAPGKQSEVYTTGDSLDAVYAFYKGVYKELPMRNTGSKLPSGQQVKWVFFILDGGKDLGTSKYWMKIQRPYVGGADGKDIRDVTVIQTVRTK
jgi:hypothetical protein